MGIVAEQPPWIEVAQAQESMLKMLGAVRQAQLTIVSRNVKHTGTNPEQEAFLLTFSEIRGMVQRAQAQGNDAIKKVQPEVQRAVDTRILGNPRYDKFKVGIAGSPDPFEIR